MQAAVVLVLLVVAIVLLATERLRADLVALMILAALMGLQILSPEESLSGFSNPATVTVACMFVLSAGLRASGAVQYLGDRLLHIGPSTAGPLLLLVALVIGPVSAFINNTAAVAVFLPIVLRSCHGNRVNPSRILMPLSYFAMLGGMCTLVGTSTNILVSSMAEVRGFPPFGMFEFTPIGVIVFIAGGLYLIVAGRWLLPEREVEDTLTGEFHLTRYLSEVVVLKDSPLVGKTLTEARLGEKYELEVLGLIRGQDHRTATGEDLMLREGDLLLVKAPASALVKLRDNAGIMVKHGRGPSDADLRSADSALMAAVIGPNSQLEGRTLKEVDFRHAFGATALAIRRHGEDIREKIGRVRLRIGDELLILAPRQNLNWLRRQIDLIILLELDLPVLRPRMVLAATLIIAGVVGVAAAGIVPIVEAAMIGSVLMVLSGCLPVRDVYQNVEWPVIFILAGVIPLGMALESSGAAEMTVGALMRFLDSWGPIAVLAAFILITSLLTGFMSNTAAAALVVPLVVTSSRALEVSPRPFLIGIALAASAAFYTPIGYQTNLLVYGPGGYRFIDFVKVGLPLTLIVCVLTTLLVPWFFPF